MSSSPLAQRSFTLYQRARLAIAIARQARRVSKGVQVDACIMRLASQDRLSAEHEAQAISQDLRARR